MLNLLILADYSIIVVIQIGKQVIDLVGCCQNAVRTQELLEISWRNEALIEFINFIVKEANILTPFIRKTNTQLIYPFFSFNDCKYQRHKSAQGWTVHCKNKSY